MINAIPSLMLGLIFGALGGYLGGWKGWLIMMGILVCILLIDCSIDNLNSKKHGGKK